MSFRILNYSDLELALDEPTKIAKLSGLIGNLRDEQTIICGSGDNTAPGVLSLVTNGEQAIKFFQAVEPDVETIGNHDFDRGEATLRRVIKNSPQTWLCSNAYYNGTRFAEKQGVTPYRLLQKGQKTIGLIGAAHPETDHINPKASSVRFTNPLSEIQDCLEELRALGTDYDVVVAHMGELTELAEQLDVDVILGGHDHDPHAEEISGTMVCRSGGTARYLLEIEVQPDEISATHHPVDAGPEDRTVKSEVQRLIESAGLNEVVGTVDEPVICDLQACKAAESRIGNLITDAYRWKTGADVAINSGGGFRRRPPLENEVTAFELVSITPYDSRLAVAELDGSKLTLVLEQLSLSETPEDLPEWDFGHVSGAQIVWDDSNMELLSARVDNQPIEEAETYTVVSSVFFFDSNHLFPALEHEDIKRINGPQYKAVLEYVKQEGLSAEVEGRVERPNLDPESIPPREWPYSPKNAT